MLPSLDACLPPIRSQGVQLCRLTPLRAGLSKTIQFHTVTALSVTALLPTVYFHEARQRR